MHASELLQHAQRLQALAQAGLTYATSPYDVERYQEIRGISVALLHSLTDEPMEKIVRVFASESGYQTPKVDVRAVLFRGTEEILLVRENMDGGKWTLPGGWADIGLSPSETALKEVKDETGLSVVAGRLLALLDKRKHTHPPQPWYVYKVFLRCDVVGGDLLQQTTETGGCAWFARNQLQSLVLSTDRVTLAQLEMLFRFADDENLPPICD